MIVIKVLLLILVVLFLICLVSYLLNRKHVHKWVEVDRWDKVDADGQANGYTILYQCSICKGTRKKRVERD